MAGVIDTTFGSNLLLFLPLVWRVRNYVLFGGKRRVELLLGNDSRRRQVHPHFIPCVSGLILFGTLLRISMDGVSWDGVRLVIELRFFFLIIGQRGIENQDIYLFGNFYILFSVDGIHDINLVKGEQFLF